MESTFIDSYRQPVDRFYSDFSDKVIILHVLSLLFFEGKIKLDDSVVQHRIQKFKERELAKYIRIQFSPILSGALIGGYLEDRPIIEGQFDREEIGLAKFFIEKKQEELRLQFNAKNNDVMRQVLYEIYLEGGLAQYYSQIKGGIRNLANQVQYKNNSNLLQAPADNQI